MAEYSPMMQQYLNTKAQYPNCILFYRLGDFYEMFFDDAKLVSRELELTLTGRECGQPERAPMCGVPYHSAETYIARLIAKGYKVAICEQMEDPATAKGIVRREIIRVVTPGTVLEGSMLDEGRNNYLGAVYRGVARCGICFADVSTGEVYAAEIDGEGAEESVCSELSRYMPREVLFNDAFLDFRQAGALLRDRLNANGELLDNACFEPEQARERVLVQFSSAELSELKLDGKTEVVQALGALIGYVAETQRTGMERIRTLTVYEQTQFMRLDLTARRNLELTETMRSKEKKGSLLWTLDRTRTAMGKRLIRAWIEQPLIQYGRILRRHDAVEELMEDGERRTALTDALGSVFDMERLMTRVVYGSANGRDLRSVCAAARQLPELRARLSGANAPLLQELYGQMDPLEDVADLIDQAIVEDPPVTIREGGLIRSGYNAELDLLKGDMTDGTGIVAQLEAKERESTGIRSLKVGFNRVFGYYIEVTNTYRSQVPEHYIRKQTLTNCERYITQELKTLENRILGAKERSVQLEYELFDRIRRGIAGELDRIQTTARAVAQLDVLCAFAETAARNHYCRPTMNAEGRLVLKDSRHPVVELLRSDVPFVPNDVHLDDKDNRVAIITGPNMAGKSTYMRQTALACIMAQCGSFVAAESADLCVVDSVYTRVGASDDLTSGQSTFMVEMAEVADILKNATNRSLLILDEIGRGTSTYDGMSIARAVLEYVADKKRLGAKALFATHYHELTVLEKEISGVKNYNIAVKKNGDDITFLRRIVRGGADRSFGIEVAKLAGVPDSVIQRAKKILRKMEEAPVQTPVKKAAKTVEEVQPEVQQQMLLASEPTPAEELVKKLKNMDLNTMTPMEAMNRLYLLWTDAQTM
ncbi:MAG: DNA mismatch repair protein MutS [Clostridia bacterium]|nr:DNA mismatch repair protein MutS [Clostridia bacterium]